MSLETEMINAQNTYLKMQQDIAELNAKRSKLQNEIEAQLKGAHDKIAWEYAAHQEKMAKELADIKTQKVEALAFCEAAKEKVMHDVNSIKEQAAKVSAGFAALDQAKAQFEDDRKIALFKIAEQNSVLGIRERSLDERERKLSNADRELSLRIKDIDNREFQLQWLADENKRLAAEIAIKQSESAKVLNDITKERTSITDKKNEIVRLLVEIKQKETALLQSFPAVEDVVALDKKKMEIEVLIRQNEELSKATAKKQEELREQAISLDEKQRALIIDMRKNEEKIQIISKLREEIKKNA